jgi:hypothetical protein
MHNGIMYTEPKEFYDLLKFATVYIQITIQDMLNNQLRLHAYKIWLRYEI